MKKLLSVLIAIVAILGVASTVTALEESVCENRDWGCPPRPPDPVITHELAKILEVANNDDLIPVWIFRKDPPSLITQFTDRDNEILINLSIMEKYNADFAEKHIVCLERVLYFGSFTGTLVMYATPSEIFALAELEEMLHISWYDTTLLAQPEGKVRLVCYHEWLISKGSVLFRATGIEKQICIADALEILKYVVYLPSEVTANCCAFRAALIVSTDIPGTADALEILKYVVGLPNAIDEWNDLWHK